MPLSVCWVQPAHGLETLERKTPLAVFPVGAKPKIPWKSHDFQHGVPANKVWRSCSKHPDVWITPWTEKSLEVCLFLMQRIKPYYLPVLINSFKCLVPVRQSICCVACLDKRTGLGGVWPAQRSANLVQGFSAELIVGEINVGIHGKGDF